MENRFFKKAKSKAEHIAKDNNRLKQLMGASKDKLKDLDMDKIDNGKVLNRIKVIIRMVRAYMKGTYRLPWKTLLLLVAALVYFVMPLDLLPDFIPVTGFVDDLGVVLWVFNSLKKEIDNFVLWEKSLKTVDD